MSTKNVDFQGFVDLNQTIIQQLDVFLEEREKRLIKQLSSTLNFPHEGLTSFKLTHAVDEWSKWIHQTRHDSLAIKNLKDERTLVKEMNRSLWEYLEILESCSQELFQQVVSIFIDNWHPSIVTVVKEIKEMLVHRLENLSWIIKRLDRLLIEHIKRNHIHAMSWWEKLGNWSGKLDSRLQNQLTNDKQYLKNEYDKFSHLYENYMGLSLQIEEKLEQMKTYSIFALLDIHEQNLYVDLFRLLKASELNNQAQKEISLETTKALKHLTSADHAFRIFKLYFEELRLAFFRSSIEWKMINPDGDRLEYAVSSLQDKIAHYKQELHELIHTIKLYRGFLLETNPNPYLRSKWSFSSWVVGNEPMKSKIFSQLITHAKEIELNFEHFKNQLTVDKLQFKHSSKDEEDKIEDLLHEMAQPLISRSVMRHRAELLVHHLQLYDELSSPRMEAITYMENVFAKALKADWKYHVLHELPLFHYLYHVHLGLTEHNEDFGHQNRLQQFRQIFDHIIQWTNKKEAYMHIVEIEMDISDLKIYLQEFLGAIQRVVKNQSQDPFFEDTIQKLSQQLLEYRYLFGQFLHQLLKDNPEGLQQRNQFIFADQYFEAADKQLNVFNDYEGIKRDYPIS